MMNASTSDQSSRQKAVSWGIIGGFVGLILDLGRAGTKGMPNCQAQEGQQHNAKFSMAL